MKLIIAGLVLILAALLYNPTITINAPLSAEPNTLVTVHSSSKTGFLVSGAVDYVIQGNTLILLTGSNDIEIITAGPVKTVIHIGTPSPLDQLVQSAPTTDRDAVAQSLRALSSSKDVKTIDELIKLTRINNRTLIEDNWKPWFTALANYLEANYQTATLQEHKELWKRIADQLDAAF